MICELPASQDLAELVRAPTWSDAVAAMGRGMGEAKDAAAVLLAVARLPGRPPPPPPAQGFPGVRAGQVWGGGGVSCSK